MDLSWHGSPREDVSFVEEFQEGALVNRIADDLAAGRVVGWMDAPLSWDRARSVTAASWLRPILPKCAIGSTTKSSTRAVPSVRPGGAHRRG